MRDLRKNRTNHPRRFLGFGCFARIWNGQKTVITAGTCGSAANLRPSKLRRNRLPMGGNEGGVGSDDRPQARGRTNRVVKSFTSRLWESFMSWSELFNDGLAKPNAPVWNERARLGCFLRFMSRTAPILLFLEGKKFAANGKRGFSPRPVFWQWWGCRAGITARFENISGGLAAGRGVWLRCSSLEDPRGIFSFVAPCHPPRLARNPFPDLFSKHALNAAFGLCRKTE
jgi:hypothetical protein